MLNSEIIYSKKDEITQVIENEIKNEIKRRNLAFSSGIFIPSRLTECDRRIFYHSIGTKIEDDRFVEDFLAEQTEKYVKNKWIDFFSSSIKITLVEKNLVVTDCNYNITGTVDCIIKKGNTEFVVLIKNQDGEPKRKDIIELMTHLWLTEKPHGLLIYNPNNSHEFNVYRVKIFMPIIMAITKKCKKIIEIKMKGEMPNRQYKSDMSKECVQCEYKSKCWSGEKV